MRLLLRGLIVQASGVQADLVVLIELPKPLLIRLIIALTNQRLIGEVVVEGVLRQFERVTIAAIGPALPGLRHQVVALNVELSVLNIQLRLQGCIQVRRHILVRRVGVPLLGREPLRDVSVLRLLRIERRAGTSIDG